MALYIFSDAHLGSGSAGSETTKLAKIALLFEQVKKDGDRLVILGDLFDFWFEYKHVVPKAHYDLLFLLHDLRVRGIQIDYVSGNHDFWMDDFFDKHLRIPVHRDVFRLEYAGKKLFLCHGDGLAKADGGYRFLKRVLRNPFNIWLYRKLPPDWAYPLAKWVSGSSREYTSRRDHEFAEDYRKYAVEKLSEGNDLVAIAHLHIPVYEQYPEGIYINTGDFIHHFSYARIDADSAQLNFLK
ncbi:MAG: UDP-2,3-diacylglucosamine diphosphatase [candidate division Zixibacteria bacterium]|nr:UDP-2,3-diacylglucosamine diphosphatase [candidate division Zixibacteria bacterium]